MEVNRSSVQFAQSVRSQHGLRRAEVGMGPAQAKYRGGVVVNHTEIVGDEQHGYIVLGLEPPDRGCEYLLAGFVDARGRFVEEQDVRLADEGECDQQPLKLAARQGADRGREHRALQSDQCERIGDIAIRGFCEGGLGVQEIAPRDWQVALDVEFLGDVSNPGAGGPANRSFVRYRADQGFEQDGLAGAVGSNDSERRAAWNREAQVANNFRRSKADGQVINLQGISHRMTLSKDGGSDSDAAFDRVRSVRRVSAAR